MIARPRSVAEQWLTGIEFTISTPPTPAFAVHPLPKLPPPPRNPRAVTSVDDRRRRFSTPMAPSTLSLTPTTPPVNITDNQLLQHSSSNANNDNNSSFEQAFSSNDWPPFATPADWPPSTDSVSRSQAEPAPPMSWFAADNASNSFSASFSSNEYPTAQTTPNETPFSPLTFTDTPWSAETVSRSLAEPCRVPAVDEIDFSIYRQEEAPRIPPRPSTDSVASVDEDDDDNFYADVGSTRPNEDADSTATAYSGWEIGSKSSSEGSPSRLSSPQPTSLPSMVRTSDGRLFRLLPLPAVSAEFRQPAKPPKPPIVQLFWAGDFVTSAS